MKKKKKDHRHNLRSKVHKVKLNSDSTENTRCCGTRGGTGSKILASVCTCCFTAETVVRYYSGSEMLLIRTTANFQQTVNQKD